jgi:hypothetical protein
MNRPLSALIVGLALLAAACGSASETTEIEITDSFDTGVIRIDSGDVVVLGNNDGITTIEATLSYSGTAPEVTADVVDGGLVVGHTCAGSDECSVDYNISLPESTALVVDVCEGKLTVTSMKAELSATTGAGELFLNTIEGPAIVAQSGDGFVFGTQMKTPQASFTAAEGDIDVSFDDVIEELSVATEKGDITVQLEGGPYAFDITADGSVNNKVDASDTATNTVVLRTASGDVEVFPQ